MAPEVSISYGSTSKSALQDAIQEPIPYDVSIPHWFDSSIKGGDRKNPDDKATGEMFQFHIGSTNRSRTGPRTSVPCARSSFNSTLVRL
jgi:hypothetical protein